jgi:hypothetical protein
MSEPKISAVLEAAADGFMAPYQPDSEGRYHCGTGPSAGYSFDPQYAYGDKWVRANEIAHAFRSMARVYRAVGQ